MTQSANEASSRDAARRKELKMTIEIFREAKQDLNTIVECFESFLNYQRVIDNRPKLTQLEVLSMIFNMMTDYVGLPEHKAYILENYR